MSDARVDVLVPGVLAGPAHAVTDLAVVTDQRHRPDPLNHLVTVARLAAQAQRSTEHARQRRVIAAPGQDRVILEGHVQRQARVVQLDWTPVVHVLGHAEGLEHHPAGLGIDLTDLREQLNQISTDIFQAGGGS